LGNFCEHEFIIHQSIYLGKWWLVWSN